MRLEEPFVYEIATLRPAPPIFRFLMEAGPVALREAYATFNMGIGMVMVESIYTIAPLRRPPMLLETRFKPACQVIICIQPDDRTAVKQYGQPSV